jgi:RND family efflux transporter MFP subunit
MKREGKNMQKRWPLVIIALTLTAASSGCGIKETTVMGDSMEQKNVQVTVVKKEPIQVVSNLSGKLLPYEETIVSFEVGGMVVDMNAKVGDSIKKGDLLTKLDPTDYQLQVEKANKGILEAQAGLNASDAAIQSAEAGIYSADVGIQAAEAGVQSAQSEVHSSDVGIRSAESGIQSTESGIQSAESGIQSAESGIQSAEAGIQAAEAGIQSSNEGVHSASAGIKIADARITNAQAGLEELNKGAREQERTQARLALERATEAYNKASTDTQRIKGLYEEGLVSKKEYEDAQFQLSSAKKDVTIAEQSLSLLLEGATVSQRKQAQTALAEAQAAKEQAEAGKGQAVAGKGQAEAGKSQAEAGKSQAEAGKGQAVASKGQAAAAKNQAIASRDQAVASKDRAIAGKDQAAAAKEQAIAAKDQAIASKGQTVAAKGQTEAAYEQALIGKQQVEYTLSKTALQAPAAGVVLEKLISAGQLVNAGEPVYRLGRTDQLKILLPVPDSEINKWKVDQVVGVTLYEEARKGKVSKIYPQTNQNTGTISVEVVIPNPKFDWYPGQVIKATKETSENKGILVPVESVISSGDEPYVFKEKNGKAVKTIVETGNLVGNQFEIVDGLKEGDKIVTRGADLLFNGDALKTSEGKQE